MRRGPVELEHLDDSSLEFAGAVTLEEPVQSSDGALQGVAVLGRAQEELGAGGGGVDKAVGDAGASCPALLIAQRLDMGGVLDLGAIVVAAQMAGDHGDAVEDADLRSVGKKGQLATNMGVGNGVVVPIEPGIRRLTDGDSRGCCQGERGVREGRKSWLLQSEGLTHAHFLAGTAPIGRLPLAPVHGLGVEIVDVREGAPCKKVVADVADGPLHPALLVAPAHAHRTWVEPGMTGGG